MSYKSKTKSISKAKSLNGPSSKNLDFPNGILKRFLKNPGDKNKKTLTSGL